MFSHVRIYPDWSVTSLSNHPPLHKHCLEREIPGSFSLGDLKTGVYLWNNTTNPLLAQEAREYFKIDNLINYIQEHEDYIDCFSFGTPITKHDGISFYFNNLDLLQHFIGYFKQQSAPLFQQSDKQRFIAPKEMTKRTNFTLDSSAYNNQRMDLLISINAIQKKIPLTKKELNCLKHLAKGKTAKEIAKILNNSHRTIEHHLNNIKRKTGYSFKSQILDVYFKQSPIAHYLITSEQPISKLTQMNWDHR